MPHPTAEYASAPFVDDLSPLRLRDRPELTLEEVAHRLATRAVPARSESGLIDRARANHKLLVDAHRELASASASGELPTLDAEWLLDNFHVIDDVFREVLTDLPAGYYDELPTDGGGNALPRIYLPAVGLLVHTDSVLDRDGIVRFVRAYQDVQPLTLGETWAVPTMLRVALLENLARLSRQMQTTRVSRLAAHDAVNKLSAGERAEFPDKPDDSYIVGVLHALRDLHDVRADLDDRVRAWMSRQGASPEDLLRREQQRQARNQVSVGNAVTSLRLLNALDWNAFVEEVSVVEKILREEASGTHAKQTFATRNKCRSAVEMFSKGSALSESEVARRAVAVAADAPPGSHESHAAYHLIGDGARAFGESFTFRAPWRDTFSRFMLRRPNLVFFGVLAYYIVALVLTVDWFVAVPWWTWVILFLPAMEVGLACMHFGITRTLPPRVPPRLDFRDGIPAEFATFVVIPGMITRPEGAAALLDRLELHYLANPDDNLHFALLTDFADAVTEMTPADEACVEAALDGVKALNAKHPRRGFPRFIVLHRKRLWNESENAFMGWERKRGKLHEFNRILRGAADTSYAFTSVDVATLPRVPFVLTLDSDTVLPRDAARVMVGTLAHPLNRARLSDDGRRVVAGYGVLQPRVSFVYKAGSRSLFARLFAYSAGIDPYSVAVSDTYMDLWGRASFSGKGLYDVDAFEATAGKAFPENHILSHDLVESNYARCGLVSDVEVFDDFPPRYTAYARREHRWVRGDWQLLPWLAWRVPTTEDFTRSNPLPGLERWKIVDNLRRSLSPLGLLLMLVFGWTFLPGGPALWTLVGLCVFLTPAFLHLCGVLMSLPWVGVPQAWVNSRAGFGATLGQAFLSAAFLPHQALSLTDAILRTLYRLAISRRRLLEWETAAAVEARLGGAFSTFLRSMLAGCALTLALAKLVAWDYPEALPWAGPFLVLWFVAPLIAWAVSLPLPSRKVELTEAERDEALTLAKKTWGFFEAFVGDGDNWLPPDNYQQAPVEAVAHRTSPTNMGLLLTSTLCAHDLDFISLETMVGRITRTLDTFGRMERYRGHFLNWYDTQTLAPLPPAYVSSVDSGNLLGCLLTMEVGLAEKATPEVGEPLGAKLRDLSRRCRAFADEMDFSFLYDHGRDLFAIGYNVPRGSADAAHYDLLASEACLTSFLAVARGDAPRKHWFQLGRMFIRVAGRPGLLSWSGTMFEYLLPRLFLPVPEGTLLDTAWRAAVARQVEYGTETGVPWGVSESAYNLTDAQGNYQYQAFGVPGLGLKRGLGRDLVVAPYATVMAVPLEPRKALANLRRLRDFGAEGKFGMHEAIDFTPDRLPPGKTHFVIPSFMAHHQGMSLLSLACVLVGDRMAARLGKQPMVRAVDLLLQERVPLDAHEVPLREPVVTGPPPPAEDAVTRRLTTPLPREPRPHLLSNGRYHVVITTSGAGHSVCDAIDVTRRRADATVDTDGLFVYLRDAKSGRVWSAAHRPTGAHADAYEVLYSMDKVEFRRRDGDIDCLTEICVTSEYDAEVRRVTLFNHGDSPREIELTSYAEPVLAPHGADLAHPAFGKLFLETRYLAAYNALACRRRPRSPDEVPALAVHCVAADETRTGEVSFETDRAAFVGRRRSLRAPEGLSRSLTGAVGAVLDPVFSLRCKVVVPPGCRSVVAFTLGVAAGEPELEQMAVRFHTLGGIDRAFEMAWAHSRVELKHLNLSIREAQFYQRLAGHMMYPVAPQRAPAEILAANQQGQSGLWRHGISGDLPTLVVRVPESSQSTEFVSRVLRAHSFWAGRGFKADLVLLNEAPTSYNDALHEGLMGLIRSGESRDRLDRPGGVFVRKADRFSPDDLNLLFAWACVVLDAGSDHFEDRVGNTFKSPPIPAPLKPSRGPSKAVTPAPSAKDLLFFNGTGGFTQDGREYVITATPPTPWSNVIANPQFGTLVTDSGGGYTWAVNAQLNRLTPWGNDPVSDTPGEAIYVRDEETCEFFSPTPLPSGRPGVRVRHGAGFTSFAGAYAKLEYDLTVFVDDREPVKLSRLRLKNTSAVPRTLTVTYYAEWVLGVNRESSAAHVRTETDGGTGTLFGFNPANTVSAPAIGVMALSPAAMGWTGDRAEFLGREGDLSRPDALSRIGLSGRVGAGFDPCGAIQTRVTLAPGATAEVVAVLCHAADRETGKRLVARFADAKEAGASLDRVTQFWDATLGAVRVKTPDVALDLLMNRWLPYQVLGCRLWGRTGFYQSGGAFGFRDQLQDVMALFHSAPRLAREQILLAASRQFREGDVQHWWHPPGGAGVRAKFSDDFLWLVYVTCSYVRTTGDASVLDDVVPFLEGQPLAADQHEVYNQPRVGSERESVYEHCARSLAHGSETGAHGLPLMGIGDWNDGMNRVGVHGKGESVWVAWFRSMCLDMLAGVGERRSDPRAATWREQATALRLAAEDAWDGEWYRRAYFDDGTPLGSTGNDECRIDSLSQSWAVLAGGDPARAATAVDSAVKHLVRDDPGLVLLFDPPFDDGPLQPGYIKGYVPGTRENGGQYTHGAIWLLAAAARLGRSDLVERLAAVLLPVRHGNDAKKVARYKVEPYVVAADIYGREPHLGRGGWTWYTGSAGWLYTTILEDVLGVRRRGEALELSPCLPPGWDGCEVTLNVNGGTTTVTLTGSGTVKAIEGERRLARPGESHTVRVRFGK